MGILLRTLMFHECDLESDRSLSMDSAFLLFTKDSQKWWKIYNNSFVEVLKENLQAVVSKSGTVQFSNEKSKNIAFGMTFTTVPKVSLVLDSNEGSIMYKTNSSTTGFTINFATRYTGNVEWITVKL